MRKTTESHTSVHLSSVCSLRSHRCAVEHVGRVGAAIVACLSVCLWLHVAISEPASCAYASTWPTGSSQGSVCLAYGETYAFDSSTYAHSGVDIVAATGEEVKAPLAGTVSFVGRVPAGDSIREGAELAGTMCAVSIKLEDGRAVTLMPFENIDVKKGQRVREGDVIGELAAVGDRSSGKPHLHMGLKDGRRYIDPMTLFAEATPQDVQSMVLDAAPLARKRILDDKGQKQETIGSSSAGVQQQVETPLPVADADPTFGTISSKVQGEVSVGDLASSTEASSSSPLAALAEACATQLDSLFAGYARLSEEIHLPTQLLVLASVLLVVLLVAAIVVGSIALIRRSAAYEKVRKNNSLCSREEGASIYGLFPAPGTSFITRGRLAQRR